MEKLYTISELESITGVKVATLRRWIKRGALKASKPGGHWLQVRLSDFDACIRNNAVGGQQ